MQIENFLEFILFIYFSLLYVMCKAGVLLPIYNGVRVET